MSDYVVAGLIGALIGAIVGVVALLAWFTAKWRWY
jgi:hypothetical protein